MTAAAVATTTAPAKTDPVTEPTVPLLMTLDELGRWLDHAAPGDVVEYHRGMLGADADPTAKRMTEVDRAELVRVREYASWAADQGIAHLVQVRRGAEDFSYRLIIRPRPSRASVLRIQDRALAMGGR